MPITPGLGANIRMAPEDTAPLYTDDVQVEIVGDAPDSEVVDERGAVLKIEHGDGSITVSLDGSPIRDAENDNQTESDWFANLVHKVDDNELTRVSEDLLRGVNDDIISRQKWIDDRTNAMKLLGLEIEIPNLAGASEGAPVDGMSKVRHPLLLEAVLRFQANARSELLPADGPVKIKNNDTDATRAEDELADALEMDFNYYLTSTATEYYPDTDRMLLMVGFGGSGFKKVYQCPLRNRPVSESVDANDLIVSNNATDLRNAKRITHRVMMQPSTLRRLQLLKVYRDISLNDPIAPALNALDRQEKSQQGISPESMNPDDRDRELYEIYCELNLKGFEHEYGGQVSGLQIPYRVTIDLSTREILEIVRNFNEDDKELPTARRVFVKYPFVPGFGFYDLGLLHILGNTTNALTAAWREMLDNGMYANFPGFLLADTGARQNTNIFRVPPGGGALVKTGGMKMSDAVMALPYSAQGMPALQAFTQDMAQTGMRIGGTSEAQVGEGRADAPVGTTLAMIEQATKVLNAVHKRLHSAQDEEFALLLNLFREDPESFWRGTCESKTQWTVETFLRAISNCKLTPKADPNTASHSQRILKVTALKQLQAANPTLYDAVAVDQAALRALGFSNPDEFFVSPDKRGQPSPEVQEKIAKLDIAKQDSDTRKMSAQASAQQGQAKLAIEQQNGLGGAAADPLKAQELQLDAATLHQDREASLLDAANRERDRESHERIEAAKLIGQLAAEPAQIPVAESLMEPGFLKTLESEEAPLVSEPRPPLSFDEQ